MLVVDDGSTDETGSVVGGFSERRLVYHRLDQGGLTRARNHALEVARGRVIVFVDDDAFIAPDYLREHLNTHERFPASMVCGPIIEVTEIPEDDFPRSRLSGYHRNPFPGCNASVELSRAREVGGFDAEFNIYGWEDLEFARRLAARGMKRRYNWRAPIHHYKTSEQRGDIRGRLALERLRGAMGAVFYRKHPRIAVGLMTKMWGPLRAIDAFADGLFKLDDAVEAVIREKIDPARISAVRRAMLIYHAEVGAGRRELERRRRLQA